MNMANKFRKICLASFVLLLLPAAPALARVTSSADGSQAGKTPLAIAQASADAAVGAKTASVSVGNDYKIGVDDVLSVNVWHEPDLSRNCTVRPDGKISLPLVGEVQAAGRTPTALEAELSSSLAKFVKDPELTVMVAEIRSRRINVIGEVVHPGTFMFSQQMGVLDALAQAGGLKEFAKKNKIYVLRETSAGKRVRLGYDYRAVLKGARDVQDILLQVNDTVVVP
jgi:polysaccharide export outer membrane protein